MRMITTIVLSATLAANAASANANPGLRAEKDINDGLFVVAVADKIRRECGSISARIFRARSYVTGLKERAVERGYSDTEIDAYIDDKTNKVEMRERRNAYFESKGASNLDAQSLCVLGHAEIQKQSRIGALLKAK